MVPSTVNYVLHMYRPGYTAFKATSFHAYKAIGKMLK